MLRPCALFALLAACSPAPEEDAAADAVDLRRDFPDPPEGGFQWRSPEYVIPPYTEQMWCYFTTWTAETQGIHAQYTFQSEMGHHFIVTATNATEADYPDGTSVECTSTADMPMTDLDPLMVGGVAEAAATGPQGEVVLPDGMAARIQEGTRIILQSHYLNTSEDPILVQDAVNLELVPEAAVETWAAPFVHVQTSHPIPAQSDHSIEFDCGWEEEMNVLFLGGHMHERGTAFRTTLTSGGQSEVIYEVPEWDPVYRDAPPMHNYELGEFAVHPGDTFTTRCEWHNDTDEVIDFPSEMCVTFGMVYPQKVPIICDPD